MEPIGAIRVVAGLTQRQLAEAAGTSQPAVAAYESQAKSPTWRTVERVADSVGLVCLPYVGAAMTRDQRRSLHLHRALAAALVEDPEEVLAHAHENLLRMAARNPGATRLLDEWASILKRSVEAIVSQMLDPNEHARDLRQVTPFAGVLTARQRAAVINEFRASE